MKKIFTLLLAATLSGTVTAQMAVGHTQITFTDASRANRAIQTEIYYPAAVAGNDVPVSAGTYPIIVFGHGFVMVWSAYQNIWDAFVPQGYIVAFPRTEGNFSPNHTEFGKDLAFLVGALQSEGNASSSLFYQHVGTTSAIMGHSMGGGSSFLAAAGNTQITTMVTLAAANTNPPSITAAQSVTVPALVIAGQNDCVAPPAQHQIPMYDSLASSCKAYLSITGGGHCYFAENNFNCSFGEGTCTPNPTIGRPEQQDAAQDMALLWLNYYLKNDCVAWTAFQDSLQNSSRFTGNSSCLIQNPVISIQGSQLLSTPATTYQWYLNGVLIPGETAQSITPSSAGMYSVQVTYYNNCPYPSNSINWISTNITEAGALYQCSVYPNPSAGESYLEYYALQQGKLSVTLLTTEGKALQQLMFPVQKGMNRNVLSCAGLEKGLYFIELTDSNGKRVLLKWLLNRE